jgi:nitroreductase
VAGEKKPYVETIRSLLEVPEKYTLVSLVPAGYPSEMAIATKKEMKHIAFFEMFKKE